MTIIELWVTPPFERPSQLGILARLTIPQAPGSGQPTIAARPYQAMDWMEHDPASEWESAKTTAVEPERARSVLAKLLKVNVGVTVLGAHGLHQTTYQLTIHSGVGSSVFTWISEAPTGWAPLLEIAEDVRALANDLLKSA